jgi:hypothetical protein
MADTRIFRITRADATTELGFRKNLSARLGHNWSWSHGRIVHIEATNPEATAGWTDVTSEFIKEDT